MHALECAWLYAKTAYGECPWLLLGFHLCWWSAVMIGGLTVEWNRCLSPRDLWINSTVTIDGHDCRSYLIDLISRFDSAVESTVTKPPFIPDRFNLSVWFSGWIGGYENAEWNRRCSPVLLGFNSAVMIGGLATDWNRRSVRFRGILVFSHALFLMSINILLSHSLN